ncbi:hypothetical protein [Cesiribacter sp. SM1]|uniref:hypothetical protein n=1 Tax=Cesiribacter sp. SM1 TaxID=2861196 RepID=UPI001CD5BDBE|nr:hypothetical protein [Cesiribacter sp. SM1]
MKQIPFVPLEGQRFAGDFFGNNCLVFTTAADGSISGFYFNRKGVSKLLFHRQH